MAAIERDKVRNAIVDRYMKCLPHVQRKLIFGPIRDAGPQLRGRQEGMSAASCRNMTRDQFSEMNAWTFLVLPVFLRKGMECGVPCTIPLTYYIFTLM